MGLPNWESIRRVPILAWLSLLACLAMAAWFWSLHKGNAATATAVAVIGCLGLILPPRERMEALPWRLRALPRWADAMPGLATLLSSPGYGLNWFYGQNPYDEVVHLLSGVMAGAVFAGMLMADGVPRGALRRAWLGLLFGVVLAVAWEGFEWLVRIIGDWGDTWTDVVLTSAGAALGAIMVGGRRTAEARAAAGAAR